MFIISTELIHVYKLLGEETNLCGEKKMNKYKIHSTVYRLSRFQCISVHGQIDVDIPSFVNVLYRDRKPAFGGLDIALGKLNIIFEEFL